MFCDAKWAQLEYTKHCVGLLSFLLSLRWNLERSDYGTYKAPLLHKASFPYDGFPVLAGDPCDAIEVFTDASAACRYLVDSMFRDLCDIARFASKLLSCISMPSGNCSALYPKPLNLCRGKLFFVNVLIYSITLYVYIYIYYYINININIILYVLLY